MSPILRPPDDTTPTRRRWLGALALAPLLGALPAARNAHAQKAGASACLNTTDWTTFLARHMQPDGRIVDFDTPHQHSTSEGQSYGMFFALVHNDRPSFQRALDWTEANLCTNGLARSLPAWQWGRRDDNSWGVLDANPASDADLWIAYCLIEAGRLWNDNRYTTLGRQVLALVAREEVMALDGLGRMLLPWPRAIAKGPLWRLNPSYLPLQLLRRFEQLEPGGPWREIADNTLRMVTATAPQGYSPDWCAWAPKDNAFVADPEKGTRGSYDAIRVYLWAGMLHAQDPARAMLLKTLHGPRRQLEQQKLPPEVVDTATGQVRGDGPVGFSGALLPYLQAQDQAALLATQLARVRARAPSAAQPQVAPLPYYERMLMLFGQGWLEGRYAFGRNGQLQTHWRLLCPPTQLA